MKTKNCSVRVKTDRTYQQKAVREGTRKTFHVKRSTIKWAFFHMKDTVVARNTMGQLVFSNRVDKII